MFKACYAVLLFKQIYFDMHPTYGTHQVASITELRTDTSGLLEYASETGEAILIQRNSAPCGVLLGLAAYEEYLDLKREQRRSGERSFESPEIGRRLRWADSR